MSNQGRGGKVFSRNSAHEEKPEEPSFRHAGVRAAVNHEIFQQKPLDAGKQEVNKKRRKSVVPKVRNSCGGNEAAKERRIVENRAAEFCDMCHRDEAYFLKALEDVATYSKEEQLVKITGAGLVAYALQHPEEFIDRMENGTGDTSAAGRMVGKFMDMEEAPKVSIFGRKYTVGYDELLAVAQRAIRRKAKSAFPQRQG